jgi:hypothetical protein
MFTFAVELALAGTVELIEIKCHDISEDTSAMLLHDAAQQFNAADLRWTKIKATKRAFQHAILTKYVNVLLTVLSTTIIRFKTAEGAFGLRSIVM